MSSIYTGVSGMRANQRAIDVIANNVANLNTVGFKGSRVSFEEALVRTQVPGMYTGTNPMQTGMGAAVASVNVNMDQGNLRATGRSLDLSMVGDGFFVASQAGEEVYTRDGVFALNNRNTLVMASNGLEVMGWIANPAGAVDVSAAPTTGLSIPLGAKYTRATANVEMTGNLNRDATVGAEHKVTYNAYDSLGQAHEIVLTLTKAAGNTWTAAATSADATVAGVTVNGAATDTVTFDGTTGKVNSGPITLAFTLTPAAAASADTAISMDLGLSNVTGLGGDSTMQVVEQDGLAPGILTDYSIDAAGIIHGAFTNGGNRVLGQVAVARFSNAAGLDREGSNLWVPSENSGNMQIGTAPAAYNQVRSGYLEESNVDLTTEFATMIVTQRAFQANTRSITAADEMMQDILQLKR